VAAPRRRAKAPVGGEATSARAAHAESLAFRGLIDLIEELRHDLPMVKNRHDPESAAFQQPTDPHLVLAALDERREMEARLKDAGEVKKDAEGNE
jgi:hypothetical protein